MRKLLHLSVLIIASWAAYSPAWAQTQMRSGPNLVNQTVNETQLVTLAGNVHPLARVQFDNGSASAALPLDRMMLVLKRSKQQEEDLARLLAGQQDPGSPDFHHWLTPTEFGERFGPSLGDIKAVTDWLQVHGFQVNEVSPGRTYIEFSGNVAQVQSAFHTSIHRYVVNGENHLANDSNPQIPAALAPVVAGVSSLHNFFSKPQLIMSNKKLAAVLQPGKKTPNYSEGFGSYALAPADYATIYNIGSLYSAGINGHGATIAVVGRSNINLQDIASFRSIFQLPNNNPQIVLNGADPGNLGGGEEAEAVLDNTWSGAVAPNATVKFVVSASTNTADGVDLSEAYIVTHNVGDVMTESFGSCEASYTAAQAASVSSLAQQAAAEGITYMVSSGDNGSDGCDNPNSTYQAIQPVSVNVLSSPPYVVSVGGNQFDDTNAGGPFWDSNSGNALSYIPEDVWNENCNENSCSNQFTIWSGSGGQSIYFSKPSWQSGVTGIPNDTVRHVPDVSLTAAVHDPYLLCLDGGCTPDSSGNITLSGIGGTSAAAPSFAGIMALVVQKTGARQGNANPVLYRLAAQENFSQCDGSNTGTLPASTCIFHDVTVGTNAVPGEPNFGTPQETYDATVGYDMASGLGSVNAANLVNNWSTQSGGPAVTLTPTSLVFGNETVGQSTSSNVTLKNSGSGTLNLTGISITGSGASSFSQSNNCGSSINAGSQCTITVTFRPTATGAFSASVALSDNASNSPQSIQLNGTGVAATCTYSISPTTGSYTSSATTGTVNVSTQAGCGWTAASNATSWLTITSGTSGTGSGMVNFQIAANNGGARTGTLTVASQTFTANQAAVGSLPSALRFVPVTPCRVADTRHSNGPFGGPAIPAGGSREFVIHNSPCGIPSGALAFSLNVTVVPAASLGYLTVWPNGQAQPTASTLNSDGRIKANAAIVPAGSDGGVDVYASDQTNVILDIDGYFVPASNSTALQFYPVAPCRVADTRSATGPLAGPSLSGGQSRAFPILTSSCGLPSNAKALSLNFTAIPKSSLSYLT
ncbi:MAG: protease pro-enzyme activation domain-containing protein, partial [Acidobacteriota bacterium]|nr:protease pro-enzyme activation domain-containing protein [Acidobacteriota bacterium]